MTDQNTEQLTDEQKAQLAEQEQAARMWTRVQLDEAAKKAREDDIRRMASMSNEQFQRFTQDNWGF